MSEQVSSNGHGTVDPRIICPTSGEICPSRESLVQMYSSHVSEEYASTLPRELRPNLDEIKLQTRLGEYDFRARTGICAGPEVQLCPVREAMDESRIRNGLVRTVRTALRRK